MKGGVGVMGEADRGSQELRKMHQVVAEEEAVEAEVEAAMQAAVITQAETLVANTVESWRR